MGDGPALLEVEDLVTSFPLKGGGRIQAVNGVSLELRRGETLAVVGEFGLRQVHAGPLGAAAGRAECRPRAVRGSGRAGPRPRRIAPLAARHAARLSGPDGVVRPAVHGRPAACWSRSSCTASALPRERRAPGRRAAADGRSGRRGGVPLSARILRRAAAADRHRPRDRARAQSRRPRRAGLRARRLDPVADPEPAAGPEGAAESLLPVHLARSGRRPRHRRPGGRDVSRADRRAGPGRSTVQRPGAPLHPGAACGRAPARPESSSPACRCARRAAQPRASAHGLSVSSTVRARDGCVPDNDARGPRICPVSDTWFAVISVDGRMSPTCRRSSAELARGRTRCAPPR